LFSKKTVKLINKNTERKPKMILRPIDNCDQCKKSIRANDLIIVAKGIKNIKLCPSCHYDLWKKYVLPNLKISRKNQAILQNDEISIKIYLEKYAKKIKQF
jgi:glutaredoxin-related protein